MLGSDWTGLSEHLLGVVYAADFTGQPVPGAARVQAPITDANMELTANWQSPFEHSGIETKAPIITAMLQSGTLQNYAEAALGKASTREQAGSLNSLTDRLRTELSSTAAAAQGRTGMTKLNSTQIFTGSAPIKLPMTLHFRAFKDPDKEVQQPLDQLARWVLAAELAAGSSLVEAIQRFRDGQGFIQSLLPSRAPQMVGFRYGGYTLSPMVIESMSHPIAVPRSSDGGMLSVAVNITLATLTALDSGDWVRARQGLPTQLFNN